MKFYEMYKISQKSIWLRMKFKIRNLYSPNPHLTYFELCRVIESQTQTYRRLRKVVTHNLLKIVQKSGHAVIISIFCYHFGLGFEVKQIGSKLLFQHRVCVSYFSCCCHQQPRSLTHQIDSLNLLICIYYDFFRRFHW